MSDRMDWLSGGTAFPEEAAQNSRIQWLNQPVKTAQNTGDAVPASDGSTGDGTSPQPATPQSATPTAPLTQGSAAGGGGIAADGGGGRGGRADTHADLQRQLNALEETAAYVTTTEQSDAIEQQRRPIIEQLRQMDEEEGRTGVYTGGDRLKNSFSNARLATQQGLTKADHRIAQTADWLFGGIAKEGRALLNTTLQSINPNWGFENEDPLITQYNKRGEDVIARNEAVAQKRIEEGRLSPTAWKYAPEVVAAIPDAVLAYFTAGASSGAQATSAGLEAASAAAQAGKAAQTIVPIANATKNMIKNPAWASAFAQTAGSSYEQALAEGATEDEANLYALLNGFANATIEVGGSDEALGGIQKLPQQLRDALEKGNNTAVMRWIKSTVNEAGEEVAQGMAEKAMRGIYTNDVPLYSATDENAVINPTRAKEEALGGLVVGGILGGGQSLLQAAINENRQSARSAQTAGQEQTGAEAQAAEVAAAGATPQSAPLTAPLSGDPLREAQTQAAESAQDAQRATPQAETPPTSENAAQAASDELNTQSRTAAREQGESAQREARLTEGADTVRGFSENVATDNAMEAALRREFEQNPEMYTRLANKDTLKKAQDIFVMGLDTARSELERAIGAAQSGQKFAPEMVPLSRMVANELTRQGELTAARKIISDVAAELTSAGQLGQAAAILRNADPVTVLNTLQKSIDAINAEVGKKFGKRNPWKAELTAEEIKQISETDFSQDGAFEAIQQQIAERLGREMPATLWEKLTELRRINMLLRPRTQIKNVASNVPMAGMRKGAETLSGAIQDALVKSGKMDASEQTRTLNVSKETREMAKEVYSQVKDSLSGASDKWDMNTLLRESRTYFKKGPLQKFLENKGITKEMKTSFLESARRFTYDCLENGDAPFVKSAFVDSLAQYCGARGINDINNVTTEAIEFATANAMEATFKNANVVAKYLNQIKRNGGPGAAALDILFPFTTTPINVTSMMLKYSPAGFADTVLQAVKGANTTDIIDSAAKATVGSAVMCLGYALRNLGLITGGEDEDKDKAAHDKAKGISPYSILGRVSYDWAQPSGGLLALGAEIADAVSGKESFADAVMNAIYTSGDSLLNLSMFQNVLRVLKGPGKPTQQLLDEIIEGGATQLMPGLAGDIAKIIDGTVRSTYTGGNVFDDTWARLTAAIPGLSKTLPESVNVKGEANTRGGLLTRAANTLINPSTVNINKANAVDNALDEVYEATGDKTIFRQVSPYKVDYGGESYQMTGEEREQFQKTQGQVHDDILQQIIDGTLWDKMDNDAKVKTMQLANEYALDAAKRELVESRGDEYSSDWDDEAELPDVDKYLAVKSTAASADVNGKKGTPNFDVIDSILSGPYKNLSTDSRDDLDNSYSRLDDMYKASLRGIDSETYYKAYALYKKYQNGSGNSTDRAEDLKTAINGLSGLGQGQKDWLAENLKLTQTMYVDTESMDKLTDAGLTSGSANKLMDDFGGIVPAQGYSGVQAAQKYQAISGASYLSDDEKWKAFFAIATEAAARDARTYWTVGYSFGQWLNSSGYGKVKTK